MFISTVLIPGGIILGTKTNVLAYAVLPATPPTPPTPPITITPTPKLKPTPKPRPNLPPIITTRALKVGKQGKRYTAWVVAYDRNPQDFLRISISGLPTGLTQGVCMSQVDRSKVTLRCPISGIPQTAGTYTVMVTANDGSGYVVTQQIPLKILRSR